MAARRDSFAVETDVHYLIDVLQAQDASRAAVRLSARLSAKYGLKGWRKHRHLQKLLDARFQKIRPIYHWIPQKFHAHVAIAFMSLLCTRHLLHRLRLRHVSLSAAAVRNLLARVESWVLDEPRTGKCLAVPVGAGPDVNKIYASAGKKPAAKTVLLP